MSSEIVFIDTYSCPQCRAELETRFHDWQGWQKCPTCGMPSLPPVPALLGRRGLTTTRSAAADDLLVISDPPENLLVADPAGAPVDGRSSHVSGARLILRTGLLVSAGLAFIFFLDHRTTNMVIFGLLSFAFFLLLIRMSRRRSSTS